MIANGTQSALSRSTHPLLRPAAIVPAAIIAALIVVSVASPLLGNPLAGDPADRLQGLGSPGHLLGTDGQGRDVLVRLAAGARLSLLAGVIPVAIAAFLGTVLGMAAGLGTPILHQVIMRTLDVFYAFPAVLLAIAIAASLGSGMSSTVLALSIVLVPPVARVAETETRRIRGLDYMQAARASGAGPISIAVRQALPNIAPAIVVYCTALIGLSIVYGAGLSFLGLGIAPPTAEWGVMVSEYSSLMYSAPWLVVLPATAILVASISFNLLGDSLRTVLDVKGDAL